MAIATMTLMTVGVLPARAITPGENGRIVFATEPGTGPQVVKTIRRDGTALRSVVAHAQTPSWAPDGSKMVFQRDHVAGPTSCSIRISNPDGSGMVDLTGARGGCERDPAFTPDGRRIVFIRDRGGCHETIWRMDLEGGARARIRRIPSQLQEGLDPNVSPDGKMIAFVGAKTDSLRALFTVRMNGSHLERITPFPLVVGFHFGWSPFAGGRLVFTEYQDGPGNIATIRPGGAGYVQITHYSGDVGAGGAVYSPDGRWILFRHQNDTTGKYAIWKMRPDGSRRTAIRGLHVLVTGLEWGSRP